MRLVAAILAWLLLGAPVHALAQGPEQLDQLEPGPREWQAEYFVAHGSGDAGEHALEILYGVGGPLAVGVEIEAENEGGGLRLETIGVKALYRFTAADAPVGIGLQLGLGVDGHAALSEIEARLIVETRDESWWAQANVMLRREGRGDEAEAGLAYAASLQHALGGIAWLGIEASGRSAPIWRASMGAEAGEGHRAGPSLTFDFEPAPGREIELGLAYFRRIGGEGPRDIGRAFVQLSF
jgi:hypothetical protein